MGIVSSSVEKGLGSACIVSLWWIIHDYGYPIIFMDMILDGHGNRYLPMVLSHPAHGQISTYRMYHPMVSVLISQDANPIRTW